jgi:hypothetical protein
MKIYNAKFQYFDEKKHGALFIEKRERVRQEKKHALETARAMLASGESESAAIRAARAFLGVR